MLLDRMIDFSCQCDGGWAGGLDGMGWDWLRDGGGKGRWDGGMDIEVWVGVAIRGL